MSSSSYRDPNANQPSPLKAHKDSNLTKKLAATVGTTTTSSSATSHRQPVIIYTHPPKIIHVKACDFKAIVQKLTGMPRPPGDDGTNSQLASPLPAKNDVAPCPSKKRKAQHAEKKKEEPVESLEDTFSHFQPSYPPPDFGFDFDHLQTDYSLLLQDFTPEFDVSQDLIYRYNEMQPDGSPSMSNMESSTLTFSDL